ncbi:hypothetical protein F7725_014883 [Dissostichus mawsoni]|uniref:WDR36/Utp21 N-terminal domain-containing protein n=1 Tax=Dissostichus mawsoni TaxID=36200 RepID=A0A7J5YFY6_DISMA|nr:hypothetical protein F7725_014883 [Dissostichus mawsoni]
MYFNAFGQSGTFVLLFPVGLSCRLCSMCCAPQPASRHAGRQLFVLRVPGPRALLKPRPARARFHKKHREFYLLTAAGKCFHTYNVNKLGIVSVSNSLSDDINVLAADRMLVFVAAGRLVSAFARNKEVVMCYHGHEQEVRLLLPLGDQLISADAGDIYLRLHFDSASFSVSAMMHPSTYLNKVLLGSSQGALQLWNIKTSKLLFTFPGWSAGVTVLQQAVDITSCGNFAVIGSSSGRVDVYNLQSGLHRGGWGRRELTVGRFEASPRRP